MDYRIGYVQHAVVDSMRADDVTWQAIARAAAGWFGVVTRISRAASSRAFALLCLALHKARSLFGCQREIATSANVRSSAVRCLSPLPAVSTGCNCSSHLRDICPRASYLIVCLKSALKKSITSE